VREAAASVPTAVAAAPAAAAPTSAIGAAVTATAAAPQAAADATSSESRSISVQRRVVPADNSCMFRCLGIALVNSESDEAADGMREMVAGAVVSRPDMTEAVLGKPPAEYADWVRQRGSWGGELELSIIADAFGTTITAIDVETGTTYTYGGEQDQRVILLYSGIHYDLVEGRSGALFHRADDAVMRRASEIAVDMKRKRQYTNTATFTLRCMVCGKGLIGADDAQKHARETSHINFEEYK